MRDKGSTEAWIAFWVIGFAVAIAAFGGLVWVVGGTWSKTDASSMTCVYNGGPFDDRDYRGYAEPGSGRQYQGFMSEDVDVPTAVRQYRVSLDPEQGDTPLPDSVDVRVKGYDMRFEPTIAFTINTSLIDGKPQSCDFIEKQLRQFGDPKFNSRDGGWFEFLNERLRPILDDSMTRVLQSDFDPGDVKFNTNGERDRAAQEVGENLKTGLKRQLGNDYLCSSDYRFGADEETCGTLTVILPEPSLSPDDEAQLAKPQRARIDANNDIAAADEAARKAAEVAEARELEADSAKRRADAEEEIAQEQSRVQTAQASVDYAWCNYLVSLGQDCAFVKAAESGTFPSVILGSSGQVAVSVPAEGP